MNQHGTASPVRESTRGPTLRCRCRVVALVVTALFWGGGCRRSEPESLAPPPGTTENASTTAKDSSAGSQASVETTPRLYEVAAEQLLAARLPPQRCGEGWIRLFDGHTLFGWTIAGDANWRIEKGAIVVDAGDVGLLCTSLPWRDYELELEFQSDPETNSGVFLRTPLQVGDPARECYEVNIAPPDNPFPTASIVQRQKVEEVIETAETNGWRKMAVRLVGGQLEVRIDDRLAIRYEDPDPIPSGRIGLQHNSGRVAFRDIQLRPLGLDSLIDADLTRWTRYPDMNGSFEVNEDGELVVDGGKTQLETKRTYEDFVLRCRYRLAAEDTNSGIFFRCIPGDEMMGYECQLNDGIVDGNPLAPLDAGTGAIFRRQPARVVAGRTGDNNVVLLAAQGPQMATWVNGLQVTDFYDDRQPDENPRRGQRLAPGTIMIQGHDPKTKAWISNFAIASDNPGVEKESVESYDPGRSDASENSK